MSNEKATLSYDNIFKAIADTDEEAADLTLRTALLARLRNIFWSGNWCVDDVMDALSITRDRVFGILRGRVAEFATAELIVYLAVVSPVSDGGDDNETGE